MKLRSYERVWKIEKQIYAIQNLRLPIPVKLAEFGYFFLTAAIIFLLVKIFPFVAEIPPIIKYGAIPFLMTKFLRKKKLDGKPPHKFFIAYVRYLIGRACNREFFRVVHREHTETVKLDWSCTSRSM